MTSKDFYETFEAQEPEVGFWCIYIKLKIGDIKIAFNKDYLDTALMCMGDETFDVYVGGSCSPLLLENKSKTIVVLPRRVKEWSSEPEVA